MARRDKSEGKVLIQFEIFAERPDMSGYITRQVQKNLLESGVEAGHIWLPKPDSPVCETGYSSFDRNEN
jgi:hypothetical protein